MEDLGRFMVPVARALLGDPNAVLSSAAELRFGTNGSMAVDVKKGVAFSHEDEQGGGVLWLIERERGLTGEAAFEFLREFGYSNGIDHAPPVASRIVQTYDYVDESGVLQFQVVRFEPKRFAQRRLKGNEWTWSTKGLPLVLYRLPDLVEAVAQERLIFIVEGEKDADALARWGIVATCNARGAGKWREEYAAVLAGADVVIIPDNDKPGRLHAEQVAASLQGIAKRVRYLTLPELPPKGDASDWIAAGGTAEAFHALAEQAPVWGPRLESAFGGMRWNEIGAGEQRYEWVVEDVLPKGEPVLIFGDSGTGKSFSTFDMALCIARGLKFHDKNVEQGLVVYVAAEGGKGFSKRKIAYCLHHNISDPDIPFYLLTKRPDFFGSETDVDMLIVEIRAVAKTYALPLVLIVIDTLSAVTPGMNENASADVGRVRARLQRLIDAFQVSTAFVHHTPKGGSTPRGHGSFTADFETTIMYATSDMRTPEGLPVHTGVNLKQREGKKGHGWQFILPVVVVGRNKWGNDETSCVAVPYGGKTKQKGFHCTKTERVFLEALFDALVDCAVPPPAGLPASIIKAVHIDEVRSRMKARYIDADEDVTKADNRFRSAFKRAGDALKAGGVIGFSKPLFWYTGKPITGMAPMV